MWSASLFALAVDGDGADPKLASGADNAHRDLAAIGDEQRRNRRIGRQSTSIQAWSAMIDSERSSPQPALPRLRRLDCTARDRHRDEGRDGMALHASEMRRDYALAGLGEADLDPNPIHQFARWFAEAQEAQVPETNAMILATARGWHPGSASRAAQRLRRARIRFLFELRKPQGPRPGGKPSGRADVLLAAAGTSGADLRHRRANSREESRAYFDSRPVGSRIAASLSRQSDVVPDRAYLEREFARLQAEFGEGPVPLPEYWGGYRVAAGVDRVLARSAEQAA